MKHIAKTRRRNSTEGDPVQEHRLAVAMLLGVLVVELLLLVAGVAWLMLLLELGPWLLGMAVVAALAIAYPLVRMAARRRFQFSVRTLLIAVAVWALLLGMGGRTLFRSWTEYRMKSRFLELGEEMREQGIGLFLPGGHGDWPPKWKNLPADRDPFLDVISVAVGCDESLDALPRYSRRLVNLKGLSLCGRVTDIGAANVGNLRCFPGLDSIDVLGTHVTDTGLSLLIKSTNPRVLFLNGCSRITDAGLFHLEDLPRLERLAIMTEGAGTMPITDTGLVYVGKIPHLKHLRLIGLKISDAGLAHLTPLSSLESLTLGRMPITDAGLAHLKLLSNLRELWLHDTNVTPQGVAELQKALPQCEIHQP